jgi:hypothetical protein
MPTIAGLARASILTAIAALAFQSVGAQNGHSDATSAVGAPDAAKILKSAADAMGMPRNGAEGGGALPEIDVINRMQFWGSGTSSSAGQSYKTDYHAAVSYNPPAMRVEMTRTDGAAPQHTFQVVRDNYAWDESQLGGGLVPGQGTATPATAALKERLLQLWILPYGVVKAAIAAGDKTKVSTENGSTVITFPLSGELVGVTEKATLDSKNFITKVETKTDSPALKNLNVEADYSDYADHGEVQTDVRSPKHVVEKRDGKTVLDIEIKMWNADNPYVVFPVPPSVKNAS